VAHGLHDVAGAGLALGAHQGRPLADAALLMQLGVDGVFVGSGIFKSGDPAKRARAIVEATTHYNDPQIIAEVSKGLGEPMVGIEISAIPNEQLMAGRGW